MSDENDYFFGMSAEEIIDYQESQRKVHEEQVNQHHNDVQIIRDLKKRLTKRLFRSIVTELYESENWENLRFVDKPTGTHQGEHRCFGRLWVDQYCEYEDCYSGYCYVQLPDGRYLKWNYWC